MISAWRRLFSPGSVQPYAAEQTAEADRGRHPGFTGFNVLAGGPGSLALAFGHRANTMKTLLALPMVAVWFMLPGCAPSGAPTVEGDSKPSYLMSFRLPRFDGIKIDGKFSPTFEEVKAALKDLECTAGISKQVGFLKLGRQFVAAPTFSAKPLQSCHLVKQIAGKP
jgi:hypothetical protein